MTLDIESIKESLADHKIIALIIPDIEYNEGLISVADVLSKEYNKILYISVDKSYDTLVSEFKQNKINTDKFYFIDCITRTVKDAQSTKNCAYVSSPRALDEIQTTILDILRENKIDAALIDSPSSLLTYYKRTNVLKFMHLLMTKLAVANCKCIFPFQKEGGIPLKRSVEMFTDKTMYLESDKSGF